MAERKKAGTARWKVNRRHAHLCGASASPAEREPGATVVRR